MLEEQPFQNSKEGRDEGSYADSLLSLVMLCEQCISLDYMGIHFCVP